MATKTSPPSKIKGFYYKTEVTTNTDGSLKTTTSKSSTLTGTFSPVTSTITDKTGKAGNPTFDFPGVTAADKAAFSNPTSDENKSRNTQIESTQIFGPNPNADQKKLVNGASGKPNAATTTSAGTTPAPGQSAAAAKEVGSIKKGTRTSYNDNMKYPINLRLEVQDVIKFSILEYSPSLASQNQGGGQFGSTKSRVVTLEGNNPIIKGSKRIGVITLPIPAGITDSNPVGWQSDTLNMLQSEAANAAKSFLESGVDAAGSALGQSAGKIESNPRDVKTAATNLLIGQAVQANIASRASGAIDNNNVELLFSGPSLRSFSFQFMFYPRSSNEAKMVRKIIRAFKQSMSVKRSESSLLLKAPHTFAISYMTAGQKAHPYLNKFKECALTSCGVEYTPDGTYMTYGNDNSEASMTAYRLSLTFQELEPIFDDEYPNDNDATIGF